MTYDTREEWYRAAVTELSREIFSTHGYTLPKVRIGCGWPTHMKNTIGAQCFSSQYSYDTTYEIFISPGYDDPCHVMVLLMHELCHTISGVEAGHTKPFIEVMRAVGMVKPWTGSNASEELTLTLTTIAEKLGPYAHAELTIPTQTGKKQSTRMVKLQCPECDYIIRTTRKHLEEKGAVICPLHEVAFKQDETPKEQPLPRPFTPEDG